MVKFLNQIDTNENITFIFEQAIKEFLKNIDFFKDLNEFCNWFKNAFKEKGASVFLTLISEDAKLHVVNDQFDIILPLNNLAGIKPETLYQIPEIKEFIPPDSINFPILVKSRTAGFLFVKDVDMENISLIEKINFIIQLIEYFIERKAGNVKNVQELEKRVKTLTSLNEFSLLINSIIYSMGKETLGKVVDFCGQIFESTHCALILNSEEKKESEIVAGWQKDKKDPSWVGLRYGADSPMGIIFNDSMINKNITYLADILLDINILDSLGEFGEIFSLKSTILVPLHRLDSFFGFIAFRNTTGNIERYREIGRTIGHMLSSALLNAKLYKNNIEIKYYLSNLIKNSRDAIISLDLSGKIILWNEGAERIFGYTEAEIKSKNFYYLFSSESRAKVTGEWIEILTGRVIMGEESVGLKKDGNKISVSYTLSPINDNSQNIVGVSIIFRDLTERRKLEQGISESKNRLQAIFDSLNDHIVLFDLQHRILMANKISINFSGFAPRELIGQKNYKLIENIQIDQLSPIEFTIKTKKSFSIDELICENRIFNLKTFPVFDSIRKLTSIILHIRELTKEKNLYAQVLEAERRAIVGELTANITKELYKPVEIVLRQSENLKLSLKGKTNEQKSVAQIIENINNINSIINTLNKFDFNPLTSENQSIVDIKAILAETINLIEQPFISKGIKIRFTPSVDKKFSSFGSYNLLQQAFISIFTNMIRPIDKQKNGNSKENITISLNLIEEENKKLIGIKFSFKGNFADISNHKSKAMKNLSDFAMSSSIFREHGGFIIIEKGNTSQQNFQVFLPYVSDK